jgi:flagellar hook-associated protein 1 FlgK
MGLLNIGAQALQANMVALQTIGNNIANANTVGYSRQNVILQTVQGQFTGAGYIGKGVDTKTIQRNYDQFLTRQSTLADATKAADVTRSDYLTQLGNIFQGGSTGVGASINDMLNAFSDVASAPTDLTARTVALTRVDESTRRLRNASQSLDDLQAGVSQALNEKISAVNTLAQQIAAVNAQVAIGQANGQPPNDLLDKRDQLIKSLNQYVQTSSVPATDGTLGIYIAGSQSLVLGNTAATLSLGKNDFGDPNQSKLTLTRNGSAVTLDENALAGGEIPGLLRFQNNDLVEGRNLLGRLTTTVTTSMNTQHALGLDLNGQAGGALFSTVSVGTILAPQPPAVTNGSSTANLSVSIANASQFVASDYTLNFTSGTLGSITRMSDGNTVPFDLATSTPPNTVTFDGLTLTVGATAPTAGDRFYLKPFSTAASNITREFSTPSSLAVASPIVGQLGAANTGSLQLSSLVAGSQPTPLVVTIPPTPAPQVKILFGANNSYSINGVPSATPYVSGQPIQSTDPTNVWSLTLQGTPQPGDTFTVLDIKDPVAGVDYKLNGGNATALMNLRDKAVFDGAAMTDGYAGMMSQIGIRSQSANYSATVSTNIATSAEASRTGVSGVNLDEEAAKLIQYQQAYQASAKMVQIAQGIFDTLIQTLAR